MSSRRPFERAAHRAVSTEVLLADMEGATAAPDEAPEVLLAGMTSPKLSSAEVSEQYDATSLSTSGLWGQNR